jgi:beta-galactosidase
VSAYDHRAPGWGTTAEKWWSYFAERPWLAGAFVWTGFDYRGEPIPYQWPCTGSHFGIMDSCGFPKDNYFYYKSWWRPEETVLHVFPHWNWPGREGQAIEVRAFTNCEEVELIVNDVSQGRVAVPRNSHAAWQVIYEPGHLEAYGYRAGQVVASFETETTGPPTQIILTPDPHPVRADGEDVASITVSVVDDHGRPVPTADNLIHFDFSGPGRLLGVGNGDPSSHESDRANHRRLFNGLALVLIQSSEKPGTIRLMARSEGLQEARLAIGTHSSQPRPRID